MQTPYSVHIAEQSKEDAALAHNMFMQSKLGSSFLAIYGDASSVPDGTGIGVGMVAYDYHARGQQVHHRTLNIGKGQIVYNGELEAIAQGFEYASTVAWKYDEVHVFADNQAAIYRIKTPSDNPGQVWQLRCMQAAQKVVEAGSRISLHWVPGHTDVAGNETADQLAKEAAKMSPSSSMTSLALTGIKIKQLARKEWHAYLAKETPAAIQKNPRTYAAKFTWKILKKICIPPGTKRETACAFYRLKIGHGYTKSYLYKRGRAETDRCHCGALQTPEHLFLSCNRYSSERKLLKKELDIPTLTLQSLLHTKHGIEATLKFLGSTGIGTRKWYLGEIEEEEEG